MVFAGVAASSRSLKDTISLVACSLDVPGRSLPIRIVSRRAKSPNGPVEAAAAEHERIYRFGRVGLAATGLIGLRAARHKRCLRRRCLQYRQTIQY